MVEYTPNYHLALPVVGGSLDTWGTELNEELIAKLDNILASLPTIAVSSADVTLTVEQWQNLGFSLTGTLTADISIIVPLAEDSTSALKGRKLIYNGATLGAFGIVFKTAAVGSTGVVIPTGWSEVLSEGTHGYLLWASSSSGGTNVLTTRRIDTTGLVTGGGDFSINRTHDVQAATGAEVSAGTRDDVAVTPASLSAGLPDLLGDAVTTVLNSITTGMLNCQVFLSSGSFTKHAQAATALVLVHGAGGSGGRDGSGAEGATGGGAGGFAIKYFNEAAWTAITSETVTIGAGGSAQAGSANGSAGGSTSFGAHVTCLGGLGGNMLTTFGSGGPVYGVVGGAASGGDLNIRGASADNVVGNILGVPYMGSGANGLGGGGGTGSSMDAATNSGAGGAGSVTVSPSGAGAKGWVIVMQFA